MTNYPPLPKKKFSIVLADPPWEYHRKPYAIVDSRFTSVKGVTDCYSTLSLEQLKQLPIQPICEIDCLLFLWVTSPKLKDGIELMESWGFSYVTIGFVWDKVRTHPGNYTLSVVELCLIGKKGKIPQPRGSRNERQLYSQLKAKHSKKPEEIRYRINRMFPRQSKIELFARETSPQWYSWGDEVLPSCDESYDSSNKVAKCQSYQSTLL